MLPHGPRPPEPSPRAAVSPTKRKNKIISIRISHEEYELLKSKHAASGRRSISVLAREAIQRIFHNDAPIGEIEAAEVVEGLRALDAKLRLLQVEVAHLSHHVAARIPVKDPMAEAEGSSNNA